jgi:hypothetical protein
MGNFISEECETDWRDGQWISTTKPNGKTYSWHKKPEKKKNIVKLHYNSNIIKKQQQVH